MIKKLVFVFSLYILFSNAFGQFQWAHEVKEFSSERSPKKFSAKEVLGKPNVLPQGGEVPTAWGPSRESNKKEEFIKVRFRKPDFIQQIVVCESYNPGAISKVYVYTTSGGEILIYENENPTKEGKTRVFQHLFEKTTKYKVRDIKVVLNTKAVEGFNYIDAIGISTGREKFVPSVKLSTQPITSQRENLGNAVNSEHFEFLPQIAPDGKTLYYSRRGHPANTGSPDMDDIWFSEFKNNRWTEAKQMPAPLNDKYPNSLYSITPDGNNILLSNVYIEGLPPSGGVSSSYAKGDSWAYPTGLKIDDFYNMGAYNEFFLSSDRHVLLMTLERDNGIGDNDMYVSFLREDRTWTKPKHLGKSVNSAGIEASPFLAADNKTLYFSSEGFSGYGKQDVYMIKRLDDSWTKWTDPVNLGEQINSNENEGYYSIPASGEYAYFVSSKQTLGKSDIFRVKLSEAIKPAPVTLVYGKVVNGETGEVISDAEVSYELLPEGILSGKSAVNTSTNEYKLVLPQALSYDVFAEQEGFLSQVEIIEKKNGGKYEEKELELKVFPVKEGQKVVLKNVTFDQGKSEMLPRSNNELDRLIKLLKVHGEIRVRLEGHTDNKGIADWNITLSQERVDAVKAYLVYRGIRANRIEAIGLGGKDPVVEGTSPLNRRVELVFVK